MADTIQNIKLPANTWVDLYTESGLTVGTQITVKNLSVIPLKLHTSASQPDAVTAQTSGLGAYTPVMSYECATNDSGDSGAWAYSHFDGLVNVKAV